MKPRKETNRIIFHHSLSTFGDVDEIRKWHKARGYEDIGYHFVIPKDSNLQHGRKLNLQGAHAGTPRPSRNSDSIGVCLIGNFEFEEPTDNQITKGVSMLRKVLRACAPDTKKTKIPFLIIQKGSISAGMSLEIR